MNAKEDIKNCNDSDHHSENVLVTFDVDGTLLIGMNKGSVHRNSFKAAIYDVFGVNDELPKYRPGTDLGISKQLIETTLKLQSQSQNDGKPQNEALKDLISEELIHKYIEKTEENYAKLFDGRVQVMPGIAEALESLSHLPHVKTALCTGNFKRIALLKIEKAQLIQFFSKPIIGGFGNNFESRTKILLEAHQNAENEFGIKFDRFIHVGDSPEDVESANQTGTTSVLVRTTPYDFGASEYGTPSFNFSNLKDHLDDFLSVVQTGRATDEYYINNK